MKLKQKSEFNAEALELLIKNRCYAPSVHCAYYSVFQLMKYAMKEFKDIGYDAISKHVATSKSSEHVYIRKEILEVIQEYDSSNYSEMSRWIKQLIVSNIY